MLFKAGDKGNQGNQQTSLSVIDLINSLSTNNVLCQGPRCERATSATHLPS